MKRFANIWQKLIYVRKFLLRIGIFWAITQRVVVIPYRRFGTTYRSHLQVPKIQDWILDPEAVPSNSSCRLYSLDHNSTHVSSMYIIPQNHNSNNNFNLWYFILTDILLFNREFYQKENYTTFKTVKWFRHILIIFVFLFSPPWRWQHKWPKHVVEHYTIKLQPQNQVHFLIL